MAERSQWQTIGATPFRNSRSASPSLLTSDLQSMPRPSKSLPSPVPPFFRRPTALLLVFLALLFSSFVLLAPGPTRPRALRSAASSATNKASEVLKHASGKGLKHLPSDHETGSNAAKGSKHVGQALEHLSSEPETAINLPSFPAATGALNAALSAELDLPESVELPLEGHSHNIVGQTVFYATLVATEVILRHPQPLQSSLTMSIFSSAVDKEDL